MNRATGALFLAVWGLGCGYERVTIRPVPEKWAPVAERLAAFDDLRPDSALQTEYYQGQRRVDAVVNYVMLGDGTRVEDPQDLLPAMEPDSPAVTYTHAYAANASVGRVWTSVGAAGLVLGTLAMLLPIFLPRDPYSPSSTVMAGLIIGGAIDALALVPLIVGIVKSAQADRDRLSAFQAYGKSLQLRLNLVDGPPPAGPRKKDRVQPDQAWDFTDVPLAARLLPP